MDSKHLLRAARRRMVSESVRFHGIRGAKPSVGKKQDGLDDRAGRKEIASPSMPYRPVPQQMQWHECGKLLYMRVMSGTRPGRMLGGLIP